MLWERVGELVSLSLSPATLVNLHQCLLGCIPGLLSRNTDTYRTAAFLLCGSKTACGKKKVIKVSSCHDKTWEFYPLEKLVEFTIAFQDLYHSCPLSRMTG